MAAALPRFLIACPPAGTEALSTLNQGYFMKNPISPWWLLSGLVAAMAVGATEAPQSDSEVTVAGVKVGIDPATGKLRPLSSEERQQLGLAMRGNQQRRVEPAHAGKKGFVMPRTEAEALATRRALPGGGTAVQVPESRMSDLVVERAADGGLRIGHGDADHGLAPVAAAEEK